MDDLEKASFPKDLYVVKTEPSIHGEVVPTYNGEQVFVGKHSVKEIGGGRVVGHYQLVSVGKTEVKFEEQ